jgi:tetratricopeptide (TPR) repeat protein
MIIGIGSLFIIGFIIKIITGSFNIFDVLILLSGLLLITIGTNLIKPFKTGLIKTGIFVLAIIVFAGGVYGNVKVQNSSKKDTDEILKKAEEIFDKSGILESIKYIDEQIKTKNSLDIHYLKVTLYKKAEDLNNARQALGSLLNNDSLNIEYRLEYGLLEHKLKNINGALAQFEYILKYNPTCSKAYEYIGDIYEELGNSIRSVYYYKMAEKTSTGDISSILKLIEAYLKSNNYKEMNKSLAKAKEAAVTDEDIYKLYDLIGKIKAKANKGTDGGDGNENSN